MRTIQSPHPGYLTPPKGYIRIRFPSIPLKDILDITPVQIKLRSSKFKKTGKKKKVPKYYYRIEIKYLNRGLEGHDGQYRPIEYESEDFFVATQFEGKSFEQIKDSKEIILSLLLEKTRYDSKRLFMKHLNILYKIVFDKAFDDTIQYEHYDIYENTKGLL